MSTTTRRLTLLTAALAYVVLSATGDHYWDEYFYLYSVRHHSVRDLVGFESDLAGGLFPDGFFSGKLAFVALLRGLVSITGDGETGLLMAQACFALVPLAVAGASTALLRALVDAPTAARAGLITLFLPLTMYFGWKPLSEMPSLLWVLLAGALWLRHESARGVTAGRDWLVWGCASACLALATLSRITAVMGFAGLGAAALLSGRFSTYRLLRSGAVIVLGHAVLVSAVLALFGRPSERLLHLAQSVTGRSVSSGLAVYAVVMTVQAFLPALLAACWRPAGRTWRMAGAWLAVTMVPFLASASYIEPRYFVLALPALALLVESGFSRLGVIGSLPRLATALATVALGNRLLFAPLMPFEIAEPQYRALVTDLGRRAPEGTWFTGWVTDYCYLAFAFPEQRVVMAMSESYAGATAFSSTSFARWVRPGHYAADLAALRSQPLPHFYVGWAYNPSVMRLAEFIAALDGRGRLPRPSVDGLLDHRTPSWIWRSQALGRIQVAQVGQYVAYELVDAGDVPPVAAPR